jgi:ArsR family transcriptional regulator, arsenate/arsenite/antimonite-responsive transcriptional repressor
MDTVEFAKVMADETRQQIMRICCCVRLTVNEIVAQTGVSQPTVSHHLKVLRDAGLVTAQRHGKEIFYSLNQEKMADNCCNISSIFAPRVRVSKE